MRSCSMGPGKGCCPSQRVILGPCVSFCCGSKLSTAGTRAAPASFSRACSGHCFFKARSMLQALEEASRPTMVSRMYSNAMEATTQHVPEHYLPQALPLHTKPRRVYTSSLTPPLAATCSRLPTLVAATLTCGASPLFFSSSSAQTPPSSLASQSPTSKAALQRTFSVSCWRPRAE